ncbi:MAG: hypothetical protein ACI9R3_001176 [Verrucomicrobiales bacterium]|jgi:hypothetical protein
MKSPIACGPLCKAFLSAIGLLVSLSSLAFAQEETFLLNTEVNQGEIIVFNGPDDLHLDPASVIIAVDVYGDDDVEVNGVTFIADKSDDVTTGVAEANGVTVTTTAANQIDDWSATTTFEGADQDSADNLATVMESIRWEGAPNPITIEVEGLTPGTPYEVQLLTNEGRARYRVWDITVEDELVADNISSVGRLNEDEWDETNSAGYRGVFNSSGAGTLSIVMAQDLGGDPTGGEDNNPILNAIVIHAASAPDPLADGLVGYWPLDGNAQDQIADSHGEEIGGVPLEYTVGRFNQGVDLDGIDQYIQITEDNESLFDGVDDDGETVGFTLSVWFRVDAFDKSWQCLAGKGEGNNWRLARNGDSSGISGVGGSADTPLGPTAVDDGELHLAVLRSVPDVGVQLFVDGGLEGESSAPTLDDGNLPMLIGENPGAFGRTWNGLIDDVGFWERPLSDDEVTRIWEEGQSGKSIGDLIGGGSDNDRDKDGLPNFYEEANGLNPDDPADAALDGDGDGLTNLEEFQRRTDITKADTDGDGLNDKVETGTGLWVSATDTGTDPRKADTDKDGLVDGVETNTMTFVSATNTGTNPHLRDTDGDGFSDSSELGFGTDPTDPESVPAAGEVVLVAHFEFEDPDNLGLDSSGKGNDADEVTEVVQVEGQFGQAAFFDESLPSSFVKTGGLSGFTGKPGVTLAAWVKLDDATSGYDGIISQDAGGCCDNRVLLQPDSHLPFINLSEHQDVPINDAPAFEIGVWTHIAMTGLDIDDGAEARVYVNGVEVEGGPWFFPEMDDGAEWNTYLGVGESGTAHRLTGALDDVRIYQGALSAGQIVELLTPDAQPFEITQVTKTENFVTLGWSSKSGRTYIIEYAADLSVVDWTELDDGVESEGDTTEFTDDDPERVGLGEGYYRVREG